MAITWTNFYRDVGFVVNTWGHGLVEVVASGESVRLYPFRCQFGMTGYIKGPRPIDVRLWEIDGRTTQEHSLRVDVRVGFHSLRLPGIREGVHLLSLQVERGDRLPLIFTRKGSQMIEPGRPEEHHLREWLRLWANFPQTSDF